MPEVNVQGVKCDFQISDSMARAFNRLGLKLFALPGVQEDYKRWCKEEDRKKAEQLTSGENEQETTGTKTDNMAD